MLCPSKTIVLGGKMNVGGYCVCTLLLMASSAFGRSIGGTVLDPSGARIIAAKVELLHDRTTRPSLTDAQGNFSFDAIPAGVIRLRVQAAGFATYESTLPPQAAQLEIVL